MLERWQELPILKTAGTRKVGAFLCRRAYALEHILLNSSMGVVQPPVYAVYGTATEYKKTCFHLVTCRLIALAGT